MSGAGWRVGRMHHTEQRRRSVHAAASLPAVNSCRMKASTWAVRCQRLGLGSRGGAYFRSGSMARPLVSASIPGEADLPLVFLQESCCSACGQGWGAMGVLGQPELLTHPAGGKEREAGQGAGICPVSSHLPVSRRAP